MWRIWITSDNTRCYNTKCYQNDRISVVLYFVASDHGVELKEIVHPETSCEKSIADFHFSIALKNVHRFVMEMETDVPTPVHVKDAFNYDGGI